MNTPLARLALATLLLAAACGRPRTQAPDYARRLHDAAAELGRRIAAEAPAGPVLLMHAELSTPLAAAMREGLRAGLAGARPLAEAGPAELPPDLAVRSGDELFAAALQHHADAATVVCALWLTPDAVQRLPAAGPPLYLLSVPDHATFRPLLEHPRCRGGVLVTRDASGPAFRAVTGAKGSR